MNNCIIGSKMPDADGKNKYILPHMRKHSLVIFSSSSEKSIGDWTTVVKGDRMLVRENGEYCLALAEGSFCHHEEYDGTLKAGLNEHIVASNTDVYVCPVRFFEITWTDELTLSKVKKLSQGYQKRFEIVKNEKNSKIFDLLFDGIS